MIVFGLSERCFSFGGKRGLVESVTIPWRRVQVRKIIFILLSHHRDLINPKAQAFIFIFLTPRVLVIGCPILFTLQICLQMLDLQLQLALLLHKLQFLIDYFLLLSLLFFTEDPNFSLFLIYLNNHLRELFLGVFQ